MVCNQRSELGGTVLDGKYRVEGPIGYGGTAVVFGAERLMDGHPVAIKMLKREYAHYPDLIRRLHWEADVAYHVGHPGLVRTLDDGELADSSPYVVVERVHGESLCRLIKRVVALEWRAACAVARRVSGVLHAVHRAGYVHRDLKPEHIWLHRAEDGGLGVRLLDFGVCQPPEQDPAQVKRDRGRVFGTPGYVAPEQAAAEAPVDARADLYSLGATLYEMLTGRAPFRGRNVAVLLRRAIEEDAPPLRRMLPSAPIEVARLVDALLARNADARPMNARVAERALLLQMEDVGAVEQALASRLMPTADAPPSSQTVDHVAQTRQVSLADAL